MVTIQKRDVKFLASCGEKTSDKASWFGVVQGSPFCCYEDTKLDLNWIFLTRANAKWEIKDFTSAANVFTGEQHNTKNTPACTGREWAPLIYYNSF